MLQAQDVIVRIAGRVVLDGASFRVPEGAKVGLVGRNGSGKSTLLRLIRGEIGPDQGDIDLRRGIKLGWLAQEAPGGERTPLEAVLAAQEERARLLARAETASDPQEIAEVQTRLADIRADRTPIHAARVLEGLGFDEAMRARPLSSFSGGWRVRVALAAALTAEPDLLLLDEPTNHLDLEAATWLTGFLRTYPRTLLIVSHDRDLLNAVPDRILHLQQGRIESYAGNYDRFARTRAEKAALAQKEQAKQAERRAHLQAFVDRFRYKASKAKQAQARLKMIERMAPIASVVDDPEIVFRFPEPEMPPPPLLTIDRADVGYDGRPVLRGLSLRLDPDDRIALLGANGNGKSTLAKLLAGRLEPLTGEVVRAKNLRFGFFAQHQIEDLMPDRSALEHLAAARPEWTAQQRRARLALYGLGAEKVETPAARLSGGEKARLTFALMTLDDPQVLILDEPTNHLDIDSRDALIEAVNGFPGAVVVISHDRHLVDLTADRLWLVADGTVGTWDGSLEDYRDFLLARAKEEASAKRAEARTNGLARPKPIDPAARRSKLAALRQTAKAAERRLEDITLEQDRVAARLADPTVYEGDPAELTRLMRRSGELEAALAEAEAAWLAAEEALEAASA